MERELFGTAPALPEDVREVFKHLCQEVASLHYKWDFYQTLFSKPEITALLSDTAGWSFQIIEESVRKDMAMAISRLCDPAEMGKNENISLANLARRCPKVPNIETMLAAFQAACEPVKKYRHKMVAHNDLGARIAPHENPVPGISRSDIDAILARAGELLNAVSTHSGGAGFVFQGLPAIGGADALIGCLKVARDQRKAYVERLRRGEH
jgi:hypothetical protein